FLAMADRLSVAQLSIFDDVLLRLTQRAEPRLLAELSTALADVSAAPQHTVRRLAFHESPEVAGPLLAKSNSIPDADLIEIAGNHGQQHLLAISKRGQLGEALTEAILKHSGKDATRTLAKNAGARFNGQGYAALLAAAERDDVVAESLGLRADVPAETLQSLVATTTDTVRARLLKGSPPAIRERVQAAIDVVPVQARKGPAHNDQEEAR